MRQTFHKNERLRSKVVLEELVNRGNSVKKHPFVLVWKKLDEKQESPIRIAFSVSKKRFPLAVDRNEMKRRITEVGMMSYLEIMHYYLFIPQTKK